MPFTLSHAAAVLPFRKLNPIWPALVMGSFAPDLQYFILISDEDRSGHHFPGIVFVTLPLALLVLWLFEWCVKGPAIELLPAALQNRLQDKVKPLSFRGWGRFASIVMWMVIGIATHLLWDQFTHGNSWVSEHLGFLRETAPVPFHSPMLVVKLLQHGSSLLGLLAVVAWLAVWYRKTRPVPDGNLRHLSPVRKGTIVCTMAVIAVFAGYPLAILRLADHYFPITRVFFVVTMFEAITLVFCTLVLIYGLACTIGARVRHVPAAQLDQHGG
jgi:hypothetical protein